MFSVIFPGQGSQSVGMAQNLYSKFDLIKNLFKEADQILEFPISKLILNGPKDKLDLTENTQPAIFLVGFSIFNLIQKEFKINLNNANFFAGHSLGEYTALACSDVLSFADTLKILKIRGKAMQNAVPKGEGGMIAVLGSDPESIEKILEKNKDRYECFIANDNSTGQLVLSGTTESIDKFSLDLIDNKIKNIKLSVSAPFHCKLMNSATKIMKNEIQKLHFKDFKNKLISNVTAKEIDNKNMIKELLIEQIESRVRWRESVKYMIDNGVNNFIEIGPGKVLSGLIKRINRDVKVSAINNEEDINNININD
tara:strand:+ start:2450 stop:3382 length:933 start_codon:yes stop_codon:yes gene_type:complete